MDLTARLHDAPAVSVLVLLTGLVLLGPTVAVETGLAAPFYEEPTVVVEPLEGGDELDVDAVPYDDLPAGEQEIFDEAIETDGSAAGTIESAEYVDYEDAVYLLRTDTTSASSKDPVLYGSLIVGTLLTTVGLVTTFSTVGMPAYGLLVDLVGPTALVAFWVVAVVVVVWTLFVPFGYEVTSISAEPVTGSPPENVSTVALADQPDDVQRLVHSTLEDSASADGDVDTVELDRTNRLPDEFVTSEYLSVDGEYYLLRTRSDAGAVPQIVLVGAFSLVFLGVTTQLTLEFARESDDAA
ncbi:hypothetical protein [Halomontanus rarus]|uniref:hypothetical protein n=1 Tax=Halomontanus rarus TaxID=3034020 RepID=UPI001A98288F